jgi:fission 1 protein
MRISKQVQRERRIHLDDKLALSYPSDDLLKELASNYTNDPSPDNAFQYAFALSKSQNAGDLQHSITMLDSLIRNGYLHQADCMYGTATANYLLGEYDKCRSTCEAILRNRPENVAAAELHIASIAAKDEEDELMAKKIAVGGTIAIAAVGLALLLGGKKR